MCDTEKNEKELTYMVKEDIIEAAKTTYDDIERQKAFIEGCRWFFVHSRDKDDTPWRHETPLTIDEAIEHCEKLSASCDNDACAFEHRQLGDWLKVNVTHPLFSGASRASIASSHVK